MMKILTITCFIAINQVSFQIDPFSNQIVPTIKIKTVKEMGCEAIPLTKGVWKMMKISVSVVYHRVVRTFRRG